MRVHRNLKPMHVVMNKVLFFAMWIECVGQVYIVCVPLEDQSYGVMMYVQRINLWTNPMGTLCVSSYMHGKSNTQRVAIKRNTCTEDAWNNTQRVGTSNQ